MFPLCFSMFGDAREMELHYFLADDTVEICERIPNNSGRDAGKDIFVELHKCIQL